MVDDVAPAQLDPATVLAGSRRSHRTAGLITGFGALIYLSIAGMAAYLKAVGPPGLRHQWAVTIPMDTALGLLGVTATVLVAFVASLWTSAQLPETLESADGRGRRLVLIDVTAATGMGSVSVGIAGALHGWGEHFNGVASLAILCLGLALAYITAEIGEFIKRDHDIHLTLQSMAYRTRMQRLRNARRCWLQRSHRPAGRRAPRGLLARLRQNLACLMAAALLQSAALLAWNGGHDLPACLLITLCIVWSLAGGQPIAHFAALTFVQRNWSALLLVSLIGMLVLAIDASLALGVAVTLERTATMPVVAAEVLAWSTVFGPLLLCVAGLTAAPSAWRRYRPMTCIRWGVIGALSRHIAKLSASESGKSSSAHPNLLAVVPRRLRTAIRTATGLEPSASSLAP